MRTRDSIAVVEAAYELAAGDESWLTALLTVARPLADGGRGVGAFLFRQDARGWLERGHTLRQGGGETEQAAFLAVHEGIPPAHLGAFYASANPCATLSEFLAAPDRERPPILTQLAKALGHRDFLAIRALEDDGRGGCVLCAPLSRQTRLHAAERAHWAQLVAHVESGLRLRRALGPSTCAPDAAQAVLTSDGRLLHAEGEATERSARQHLRDAALACERARGPLRRADPVAALELWTALVDGRWSLVDRFDSDGRRFIVARENAPSVRDPRGLSPREWAVAQRAARGHANKLTAYELGLPPSTVATHLASAMHKLGVSGRAELTAIIAQLQSSLPESTSTK